MKLKHSVTDGNQELSYAPMRKYCALKALPIVVEVAVTNAAHLKD